MENRLPAVPESLSSPRHRVGQSISHADNVATKRLADGRLILVSTQSRKKTKKKKKTAVAPRDLTDFAAYIRGLKDMMAVWEALFALRTTAPRVAESILDTLHEMAAHETDDLYRELECRYLPEKNLIIHRHPREGMFDLTVQRQLPRMWHVYAFIPEGEADEQFVWYQAAAELSAAIAEHKTSLRRAMVDNAVRMSNPDATLSIDDLSKS